MTDIDPTQAITIGGAFLFVFTGLMTYIYTKDKAHDKERKEDSEKLYKIIDQINQTITTSNEVMTRHSVSQEKIIETNVAMEKTLSKLGDSVTTNTDYMKIFLDLYKNPRQ